MISFSKNILRNFLYTHVRLWRVVEFTPSPSRNLSSMCRSYNRIPQLKSNNRGMLIMPRDIVTMLISLHSVENLSLI